MAKFRRVPLSSGVECRCGMKKSLFSTNISLYLGNCTSLRSNVKGTCMRSNEWCHSKDIEWPLAQTSRERQYSTLKRCKFFTNTECRAASERQLSFLLRIRERSDGNGWHNECAWSLIQLWNQYVRLPRRNNDDYVKWSQRGASSYGDDGDDDIWDASLTRQS